ncbi:MAG: hypothetical protein ACFFDF_00250 [Candidatus Odinarchaeota archaeon]
MGELNKDEKILIKDILKNLNYYEFMVLLSKSYPDVSREELEEKRKELVSIFLKLNNCNT